MADGARYSRTLGTKMDAEAWLAPERSLIDRDEWTPPRVRQDAEERRQREAAFNTVEAFAKRYLAERGLRPSTVRGYRQLLATRILPRFGALTLSEVTLTDVKTWRASLDPATEATTAAAYRLLRSLLQAAEEEELIDRAPPKIRGAGSARVKRVAKPATFEELRTIIEHMPDRLRLLTMLAAYVGLREGELLELRRSDVDGVTGRISVLARSTRTSYPERPERAATAVALSAPQRPRVEPGPYMSHRRFCRCCRSTYLSTPPRVLTDCCSPATAPIT